MIFSEHDIVEEIMAMIWSIKEKNHKQNIFTNIAVFCRGMRFFQKMATNVMLLCT